MHSPVKGIYIGVQIYMCKHEEMKKQQTNNQRTNGPVNAHLISGPSISTKHTKPI